MKYARLIGLALAASLACCIIHYLLLIIGFDILGFTILFIIPMGGIFIGLLMSLLSRYVLGFPEDKTELYKVVIITMISATLLVLLLSFVDYASCFVEEVDGELIPNRTFKGEHISDFVWENELITFAKYIKITNFENGSTIRIKGGTTIDTSKQYNSLMYILQYIGAFITPVYLMVINPKTRYEFHSGTSNTISRTEDKQEKLDFGKDISHVEITKDQTATIATYSEGLSSSMFHSDSSTKDYSPQSIEPKNQTKHCSVCGALVPSNANHCPECGNAIEELSQISKSSEFLSSKVEKPLKEERSKEDAPITEPPMSMEHNNPRICPKCGTRIPDEGVFCPQCGYGDKPVDGNISEKLGDDIIDDKKVEQLRKIKVLYDEGILTEDEFQEKKRQILNL